MNDGIFASVTDFHTVFMQGLDGMLRSEQLNAATFNLVFGNAILHHKERDLVSRLEMAKVNLAKTIDKTRSDDDTKIFLKLQNMKLDWQNWTMIEDKKINSWNIQLNKFRVLKPMGFGVKKITEVFQKFDENNFNFNKVKNPNIWRGPVSGRNLSLYYNKFPYKDLQSILVLDPTLNKEQFLIKTDHFFIWDFCNSLKHLYNTYIGYNSLGAFASVNHLHFHLLIGVEQLTVVNRIWEHNGGGSKYPATIFVFDSKVASWDMINMMNSKNIPYNLLYTPGKIYVFPRRFQGTYSDPVWSTGLGWYEFSGNFIVYSQSEVDHLTNEIIENSLAKASINLIYNNRMAGFIKVASLKDLKEGSPKCAEVGGQKLAIFKVGDQFFATANLCTHAGGPLCEGSLEGNTVTCPWHGSKFDITTGKVSHPPAQEAVKVYKTRVNGDDLEVDIG